MCVRIACGLTVELSDSREFGAEISERLCGNAKECEEFQFDEFNFIYIS